MFVNVRFGSLADIGARIENVCFTPKNGQGVPASRFVLPIERRTGGQPTSAR